MQWEIVLAVVLAIGIVLAIIGSRNKNGARRDNGE